MTSTLTRTLKNQPANEELIRNTPPRVDWKDFKGSYPDIVRNTGPITREDLQQGHKECYGAMEYEIFESSMVKLYGLTIIDEVA